jgi:hypothetical protein
MCWPFYLLEADYKLRFWVCSVIFSYESKHHIHVRELVETPLASKMNAHRDTIHDFPPLNKLFDVLPLSETSTWNLSLSCFRCYFGDLWASKSCRRPEILS